MEVFERTDSATVFWGQLALPDVVVRARAPFEYTYYLDLNKTWELTLKKKHGDGAHSRDRRFRVRHEVSSESILRDEEESL